MKLHLQSFSIYVFAFLIAVQGQAQATDTIIGADNFPQTQLEIEACTICSYDIFYGATFPYTPSNDNNDCSSDEKDQYIGFVTNNAGAVSFVITSFGCLTGPGLEIGLYDGSNQKVNNCFDPQQQQYSYDNLIPNAQYYIRVAGKSRDECAFYFQAISGFKAVASCAATASTTTTVQDFGFNIHQSSASTLQISGSKSGWQIKVLDVLGRPVLNENTTQNQNHLFVGDLAPGPYFIVVQNGNQLASQKWVKW